MSDPTPERVWRHRPPAAAETHSSERILEPGTEVVRAAFYDQKQLSESDRHITALFGGCVQNNRVEWYLFCDDEVKGKKQSVSAQDQCLSVDEVDII